MTLQKYKIQTFGSDLVEGLYFIFLKCHYELAFSNSFMKETKASTPSRGIAL